MKNIFTQAIILFFIVGISFNTYSQNVPGLQWSGKIGSSSSDNTTDITVDQNQNVIVVGRVQGYTDMDPGPGIQNAAAKGALDMYILKLDPSGNYIWSNKFTAGTNTYITGVTTDHHNNIYVTGYFNGTGDFDPGPGVLTFSASGTFDSFVSKFDENGNLVWSFQLGAGGYENANAISYDGLGNILITGRFSVDSVDFDPSINEYKLWPEAGGGNIFLWKLDTAGNFKWAHSIGTGHINPDIGFDIQSDSKGNVYATGTFFGSTDFDPGAGTAIQTAVNADIFLLKLDSSGNYKWAFKIGSSAAAEIGRRVRIDNNDNVVICGEFWLSPDFDPGSGTATLTALNGDAFVAKYDSLGNYIWAKNIGNSNTEYAYGLALDPSGGACITGMFGTTLDFDPGAGVSNLTSVALRDAYIMKLNANGNFEWAGQLGSTSQNEGRALYIDDLYQTYWSGTFFGTIDADPSAATNTLVATGANDVFISKYSVSYPLPIQTIELLAKEVNENQVNITWKLPLNHAWQQYELEFSLDAKNFYPIDNGASLHTSEFSYAHLNPPYGVCYYRLKLYDINLTHSYSNIATLNRVSANTQIQVINNNQNELNISSNKAIRRIKIYTSHGQCMGEFTNTNRISVGNWPKGLYILQADFGNEIRTVKINVL
ncbi:MAG: T9SS type A sorting domain-containing protein [Chitinophagaceae bacterium]